MTTRATFTLTAMFGSFAIYVAGCGSASSTHPAQEAVKSVIAGIEDGRPIVAWEAMPASYQTDINELVQAFGSNMDPEAWGQVTGFLSNIHEILASKQQFILNHPKVAGADNSEVLQASIKQGTTTLSTLLETIQDLDNLKSFDGANFLNSTGKEIAMQMIKLQEMANQSSGMNLSSGVKVETLESTDTSAKLRLTSPDGKSNEVVDFVLEDGKWLPKDMVVGWDEQMEQAKVAMTGLAGQADEIKSNMMMVTMMTTGVLAPLKAAENQEQFNQAVDGVIAGAAGMMGGMMGGMGGPPPAEQGSGSQGFGGDQ